MVPIDLILDAFDRLKVESDAEQPSDVQHAMRSGLSGELPDSRLRGL
jgi:hypothetical protein